MAAGAIEVCEIKVGCEASFVFSWDKGTLMRADDEPPVGNVECSINSSLLPASLILI